MSKQEKIILSLTLPQLAAAWGLALIVKNQRPELYAQDEANKQVEALLAKAFFEARKEAL